MRRAGQQHDDFFLPFILAADPLSGRAAIGVGQDDGPGHHVRLLEIIGRHVLPAARREASFQTGDNLGIAAQSESQCIGYRFTSEIVFRRSQAAHEDHDLGTRKCQASRARKMFAVVAHDGLEYDIDAQQVELFREIKRVRILAERSQQLRADGNNFSIHG